jgi:hypothetical protein
VVFSIRTGVTKLRFIILCFGLLFIIGCVNKEIVQLDYLVSDSTKDVLITTNSGKSIHMLSDHYQVVKVDSTKYIRGKGTVLKDNGQSISLPFDGQISFSEIVQVETREKTVFYYSGYYIFAGAAVFIVFVILLFNGRGAGG